VHNCVQRRYVHSRFLSNLYQAGAEILTEALTLVCLSLGFVGCPLQSSFVICVRLCCVCVCFCVFVCVCACRGRGTATRGKGSQEEGGERTRERREGGVQAKTPIAFVQFAKPYTLHPTPYSLHRDPLHPTPVRRREHLSNLRRSGRHDRFRVLSV
jgi:hypothetical protein